MTKQEVEARRRRRLGTAVFVMGVIGFFILLGLKAGATYFTEKTVIFTDFNTVTGLRQGSPVQLAGVEVGRVKQVDFVHIEYECDPLTEDLGRYWSGRTNDCDEDLFCAPTRLCADLEPYAGKPHHSRCDASADCDLDEVCITTELRNRQSHVEWAGPHGVCARFKTTHWRTRVQMELPSDQLPLIRVDSRANVAANSVLGDQLVNISPGRSEALTGSLRIHARSSLNEDIDKLRKRVKSFLDKADVSIVALTHVFDELRDEATLNTIKSVLFNLEIISRDAAFGDGLVGGLLSSPQYRNDVGKTLGALHSTSRGLDRAMGTTNRIGTTLDRNIEPVLKDARATIVDVDQLLLDLDDPTNKSLVAKLLRDDEGNIVRDLEGIFENTAEFSGSATASIGAVENADGTLGLLIKDDSLGRDITRLLNNLATHGVIRSIALYYLETKGISAKAARRPGKP